MPLGEYRPTGVHSGRLHRLFRFVLFPLLLFGAAWFTFSATLPRAARQPHDPSERALAIPSAARSRFTGMLSAQVNGSLCGICEASSFEPAWFAQNVMTIDYHIAIGDPLSEEQKREVQRLIEAVFLEVHETYDKWNPRSELSLLNALPAHTPRLLSPQMFRLFQRLEEWVALSEGRFDPTIEPLQQLWKTKLEEGKRPSPIEIEELKPCIGWSTLHFEGGIFYKEDGRTQLDLGGVAKGLCVDLLVERLQGAGFEHLLVEWGGEMRASGLHPSKRPWRVFIRHPSHPDPLRAIAQFDLVDSALATSGDYFQYWILPSEEGETTTYCHIFNPLTATPLQVGLGSIASASLLAADCATADALAKVLMLFDSIEEAENWLQKLQADSPNLIGWIAARKALPD